MKSLRTLHFHDVVYKDSESVRNLFCSCPNLEHLVLHRVYSHGVELNFVIEAPSLKTLSLYGKSYGQKDDEYVINAPSLKYLSIEWLQSCDFFLIENASELVEADVRNVSAVANETILGSLSSAKRLYLDLSPLQITNPTGFIFYRLLYLEMCTHKMEWWNLLTAMLDSSPKLQVLKLIDHSSHRPSLIYDKKKRDEGEWNRPEYVPECLLSHLETFVWTRHDWIREEEKEVARYILSNARQLKKATFYIDPIESRKHFELAKRRKMLDELPAVVRASGSCDLVIELE
ncbi:unnamed protein product [Thlaspi arvense]|uniref:FBD domain-containing protein n=1 Tax=Thlaspi arvense TaxID=13288 RepID=A0AAU9R649_THLAR|nr:unnamed protein product [Thlaspi arvense]